MTRFAASTIDGRAPLDAEGMTGRMGRCSTVSVTRDDPPSHGDASPVGLTPRCEHAWQFSVGLQRQLGACTSVAVDANLNRRTKHGFLDMNAPTPIAKDVLEAALARTFAIGPDKVEVRAVRRLRSCRRGHGRRPQHPAAPSSSDRSSNVEAQRLTPPIQILKVARVAR